jgi:TrpR-related protein YerC/YecD
VADLHENEGIKMLVKAIMSIDDEKECFAFLDDIMTRKELIDISQRLMVAKMLSEQAVYNKIVEETGASTATISRVNRAYNYGSGGYASILEKIK